MGYETTTKLWVMSTIPNTLRATFLPFEDWYMPENEWSKPPYFIDFFREKIGSDMWKVCGRYVELKEEHCREYLIKLMEARRIFSKYGYENKVGSIKKDSLHYNEILKQLDGLLIMNDYDRKYISVSEICRQYDYFQWLVDKMEEFKKNEIEFYVTMEIT